MSAFDVMRLMLVVMKKFELFGHGYSHIREAATSAFESIGQ